MIFIILIFLYSVSYISKIQLSYAQPHFWSEYDSPRYPKVYNPNGNNEDIHNAKINNNLQNQENKSRKVSSTLDNNEKSSSKKNLGNSNKKRLSSTSTTRSEIDTRKKLNQDTNSSEFITLYVLSNGEFTNPISIILTSADCQSDYDVGEIVASKVIGILTFDSEVDEFGFAITYSVINSWGLRVASCLDIRNNDIVYILPSNRVFIWPTVEIGHKVMLNHIDVRSKEHLILETISQQPKIFKLHNFISEDEASTLVDAFELMMSNDQNIGSNDSGHFIQTLNPDLVKMVSKRAMDLFAVFPYEEAVFEGLKLKKFTKDQVTLPYYDYISADAFPDIPHNWNSSSSGTNRFATIAIYLSTPVAGGDIVFSAKNELELQKDEISIYGELTSNQDYSDTVNGFLSKCDSNFKIKPKRLEAILYYNQLSSGEIDNYSLHGDCPLMEGEKYVAYIWIWNGPRLGYWNSDDDGNLVRPINLAVSASFESHVEDASLFWKDQLWDHLIIGRTLKVNTFPGHEWNIRIKGIKIKSWKIKSNKPFQRYILKKSDLIIS